MEPSTPLALSEKLGAPQSLIAIIIPIQIAINRVDNPVQRLYITHVTLYNII